MPHFDNTPTSSQINYARVNEDHFSFHTFTMIIDHTIPGFTKIYEEPNRNRIRYA